MQELGTTCTRSSVYSVFFGCFFCSTPPVFMFRIIIFERRQTSFLIISYGTSFRPSTGKTYFIATLSALQRLLAESHSICSFKIYRKTASTLITSYKVVTNLCVTYFNLTYSNLTTQNFDILQVLTLMLVKSPTDSSTRATYLKRTVFLL